MLKDGAIVLTIEGKASRKTMNQLIPGLAPSRNTGWFFVDFAVEPVPINTKFDVVLEGASKQLLAGPGAISIELKDCIDQFGNKLLSIPKGYNTICELYFSPRLRRLINSKLPTLAGWDYNPDAISIARHNDIELAVPDVLRKAMYQVFYKDLKRQFRNQQISRISRNEFTSYLHEMYNTPLNGENYILEGLLQLGKVTRKDGDYLELVEEEAY